MYSTAKLLIVGALLFKSSGCAELISTEEDFAKKINSLFAIGDEEGALKASELGMQIFPNSKEISHLYIKALSDNKEIEKAISCLGEISSMQQLVDKFSLIEEIAWNQLLQYEEGKEVGEFLTMYGAATTNDARAVPLIQKNLNSTNAYLRYLATRLTCYYNDLVLQKELIRLLEVESNWFVRSALVEAVGTIRLREAEPYLKKIIESRQSAPEEKAKAIYSLISLYDRIEEKEIDLLLQSSRSGIREFAAQLIISSEDSNYYKKLYPLLKDSSADVRMKALYALGALPIDLKELIQQKDQLVKLSEDVHPYVSALSYWVLLKIDEDRGKNGLMNLVKGGSEENAKFSASLMGLGGLSTLVTLQRAFEEVKNPYVKANLALSMIRQNSNKERACQYLQIFLLEREERIMWQPLSLSHVRVLTKSKVRHVPYVASYPVVVDQMTRLDIINYLSLAGMDNVKGLIREHLKAKAWGVAGNAAVLLLEEGEIEAIETVKELLYDPEEKVSLQAALALAFYAKDAEARQLLEEKFSYVDWDTKIHILEALGTIGSRESIPFLMRKMKEGSPMLRKIAAVGVIKCLYH